MLNFLKSYFWYEHKHSFTNCQSSRLMSRTFLCTPEEIIWESVILCSGHEISCKNITWILPFLLWPQIYNSLLVLLYIRRSIPATPALHFFLALCGKRAHMSTVVRRAWAELASDVICPMASHWRLAYQSLYVERRHINVLLDFLSQSSPHKQSHIATSSQRIISISNTDAENGSQKSTGHAAEYFLLFRIKNEK